MSLVGFFKGKGKSGFGYDTTAEEVTAGLDLAGRTYLVTGCNSGLGRETLRVLSLRGARVIGTARTEDKAREACAAVAGPTLPLACELADPVSVRACVDAVKRDGARLDGLIANAGIMALPRLQQAFGYELQFFTNHVGHFLLVTGLLDRLADDGRVVILSSAAHRMTPQGGIDFDNLSGEKNYRGWKMYGQSKLANLLFARELARRLQGSRRTANAVHPGVIRTNLGRHMGRVSNALFGGIGRAFFKTIPRGAATEVWAATHPDLTAVSGEYLADCNVAVSSPLGRDPDLARRLWEATERIVAEIDG